MVVARVLSCAAATFLDMRLRRKRGVVSCSVMCSGVRLVLLDFLGLRASSVNEACPHFCHHIQLFVISRFKNKSYVTSYTKNANGCRMTILLSKNIVFNNDSST